MITFTHYSPKRLTVLDPKQYGTGPYRGKERSRRALRQVCLYGPGSVVEREFMGYLRHTVQLGESRLYDLSRDPSGYLDSAPSFYAVELRVKRAGYIGYWLPNANNNFKDQARLFHAVACAALC